MKSIESMVIQILGSIALKFSTTCPLEQLLTVSLYLIQTKFFVFMVDSAPKSKLLIKSGPLIEKLKSLMKGPSVTSCGQTQKILKIGLLMPEEQAGFLDLRLQMIFATLTG